ncbi:MAG: family tricarboxylate transporter, receptor protein [Hyphomicrobiales bacterium]|jgi:tripartite-type tricarboxylate transporter receptor subunit TctC|nr:family tricarboxylate transporter, receptor protein [Hyphomicrobiales bacterium]
MLTCFRQVLTGVVAILLMSSPARADAVEDFYRSKSLTLVVGYSAGGGFDLYARSFAKHFRNHVPGNPTIVVQNMPGAGSLTATNYIYNVSPKDGSVIALARAPVMELLAGTSRSAFETTKFTWIGNGATELSTCALLHNPQVKTFADAQKHPFTLAGLGPGSDEDMFTKILNNLFDLKARLINGYPGGAEAMLAVERGEVDGRCGWSYSSLTIAKPEWVTQKRIKVLATLTLARSTALPDTPSILELASTDRQRQILGLVIGSQTMGRPFFAPPGVPADRAAALRKAFDATMADPAFIADRRNVGEEVNPATAQEIEALLAKLFATPRDLIQETRAIIAGN